MSASDVHAVWCVYCGTDGHNSDPACWGPTNETPLTMEEGYDHSIHPDHVMELDPPRIGVYAYRQDPQHREVIYLHAYRPSENDHLSLDASLHLTAEEANQLAGHLIAAAERITGGAK